MRLQQWNANGWLQAHQTTPVPDRRSSRDRGTRSGGLHAELIELAGKSLLLPKDPAFQPDEDGLKWRCQKLIA